MFWRWRMLIWYNLPCFFYYDLHLMWLCFTSQLIFVYLWNLCLHLDLIYMLNSQFGQIDGHEVYTVSKTHVFTFNLVVAFSHPWSVFWTIDGVVLRTSHWDLEFSHLWSTFWFMDIVIFGTRDWALEFSCRVGKLM